MYGHATLQMDCEYFVSLVHKQVATTSITGVQIILYTQGDRK